MSLVVVLLPKNEIKATRYLLVAYSDQLLI